MIVTQFVYLIGSFGGLTIWGRGKPYSASEVWLLQSNGQRLCLLITLAAILTWTSEPGGEGGLDNGDWGTGRVVTEGLGWSSDWGCWRTWPWWAQRHPMASDHSGPWWPLQPLSSYRSGWSPRPGSHLRGQKITTNKGPFYFTGFGQNIYCVHVCATCFCLPCTSMSHAIFQSGLYMWQESH